MSLVELFGRARTGVVQILHFRNGTVIGSGSGFFLKGMFITNYHVAAAALSPENAADLIGIRLHSDPPNQPSHVFKCDEFARRVRGMSEEMSFDYLIAEIPEAIGPDTWQFTFAEEDGPELGRFVAFQGYPFGQPHLAGHAGYVSCIYKSGVATMIQLDANVNSGNSGGPLVDVATGKVLGVVSRKQTGLTEMFDELVRSFEQNARVLGELKGGFIMRGISLIEVLTMTQEQLGKIAMEIQRSANVGIGFAVKATALREEPALASA